LQAYADERELPLRAEHRDIERHPPGGDAFDVIVVSRYLERRLVPSLITSLRQGGVLFYQTFIRDAVHRSGPGKPIYRLETNELLELFSCLRLVVYREEGTIGDVDRGFRDEAMLVAMKR
jgi:SAM-dependent methyltransferase